MKKLKNNIVICNKGFEWNVLFSKKKFLWIVCQIVTLSRYTHSYVIIKKRKHFFKLESDYDGIFIKRVHESQILKLINSNRSDAFYRRPHSKFSKEIPILVEMMISNEQNNLRIGRYSYVGLFNQALLNLFGKGLIKSSKLNHIYPERMFCSELVHYYMTGSKTSFLVSPCDIAINDDKYVRIK